MKATLILLSNDEAPYYKCIVSINLYALPKRQILLKNNSPPGGIYFTHIFFNNLKLKIMKSIFTFRQFQNLKSARTRFVTALGCLLALLSFSNVSWGQTPANCKLGCTSNDVQIQKAYLSNSSGTQLPPNFVCPISGTAVVYLTLELTTKTPRVGVVIYAKVKNFTPPSTIGSEITTIAQCFGTTLNQPTNKVTFTAPFNWSCGTSIVLTDVFIGWGTGNTNFCTGTGFQCPATSSKCYSLPPGSYIPIQTPTANPASATLCSTSPGGTTATFNLTALESTVKGSQTNVTVTWFTDAGLTNQISTPASYTSGTANVYAKVTSNSDASVFSQSTVSLTVNSTPVAPGVDVVNNCDGSSDLTATGFTGSLLWSNAATTASIHVTNAATYTVTQTVNGCTSASGSGTSAPKTTPGAPTVGVVNNCDGSSDLTATNFTGSLLWSNAATTASIHVTNAATYTVTQTVNGCTSASGSGTSAPKTTSGQPSVAYNAPVCDATTFSVTVSSVTSGATYSILDKNGSAISGISPASPYLAPNNSNFSFSNIPAGSGYKVTVTNNGCLSSANSCGTATTNSIQAVTSAVKSVETINAQIGSPTKVLAAPNPFNDRVKFSLQSAVSGQGSLELYNLMGQRVKTVFQGYVQKGQVQNIEYSVPGVQRTNLIYIFRVGDQRTSGKLINLK